MYAASRRVIAAFDDEGYGLLVNLCRRTARNYCPINPTITDLWCLLEDGDDLRSALATLAERHHMTMEAFEEKNGAQIGNLRRERMLARRWRPPRRGASAIVGATPARVRVAVTEADAESAPFSYRAAVLAGFFIAPILQRLPYGLMLRIMRASRHVRPQRPTLETARRLMATATRFAERDPGWAECHEIAIGAFLGAVIVGCAPDWSLEVAWDPFRLHVCLRIADTAIDHAPQGVTVYLPLIQI